jgi:hypothetical protein
MANSLISFSTAAIDNWNDFHEVSKSVFGFPDFYGRNLNAWIDYMSSLEEKGMTRFVLSEGDVLNIEITDTASFIERLPDIFAALMECTAIVNRRYEEFGSSLRIVLILM